MSLNGLQLVTSLELQSYFVDKQTGLPLTNGVAYFYQDINRNNPKPVYQISGSPPNYTWTALPNPLPFTQGGTFSDGATNDISVYYFPYQGTPGNSNGLPDNYYIAVYAQPSVPPYPPMGTPEFTREFVPGVTQAQTPAEEGPISYSNVVTNSQFAQVFFNPAVGLSVSYTTGTQTFQFAPGWFIKISASGGGAVTINRTSITGIANFATNPPYSITVNPGAAGNITSLVVYQQFTNNPNIFAGQYVNAGIALGPNSGDVSVYYAPQGMISLPAIIMDQGNPAGIWQYFNSSLQLALGSNAQNADSGYTQFQIMLPTGQSTTFSSFQVVSLGSINIPNVPYNQVPVIEQINSNSFYQQPLLAYKPISSYLVGWDFPLNPSQILGDAPGPFATGANSANYVWDQTIVFQTANSGVSASRATNGGLTLTSGAAGQIAVVQYLDQSAARKILNDRASAHMSVSGVIAAGTLAGNVTLWATTDATLPTLPTCFISTMGANGIPATVSSGNWVQVPNVYQNNSFTVSTASATNAESADIYLNGWDEAGAAIANTATFFAIVVGFSAWANADTLTFNSIGLCPGDIATRPAPKTYTETLMECQHYYEKSLATHTLPAGAATLVNSISSPQAYAIVGGNVVPCQQSFTIEFKTIKRTASPTMYFYSPVTGTVANVSVKGYVAAAQIAATDAPISGWPASGLGNKSVTYLGSSGSISGSTLTAGDISYATAISIIYHYIADARLGVVN